MRSTVALSITLPHKMAAMVRNKVKSGQYASESEVMRAGLRALSDQDDAVEHWLRTKVVESYENLLSDPASAIPASKVMPMLRARWKARAKGKKV